MTLKITTVSTASDAAFIKTSFHVDDKVVQFGLLRLGFCEEIRYPEQESLLTNIMK